MSSNRRENGGGKTSSSNADKLPVTCSSQDSLSTSPLPYSQKKTQKQFQPSTDPNSSRRTRNRPQSSSGSSSRTSTRESTEKRSSGVRNSKPQTTPTRRPKPLNINTSSRDGYGQRAPSLELPDGFEGLGDIKDKDPVANKIVNCFEDFTVAYGDISVASTRLYDSLCELITASSVQELAMEEQKNTIEEQAQTIEDQKTEMEEQKEKMNNQLRDQEEKTVNFWKDHFQKKYEMDNDESEIQKLKDENSSLKLLNTDLQEERSKKEQEALALQAKLDEVKSSLEKQKSQVSTTPSSQIMYSVLEKENETMKGTIQLLQKKIKDCELQVDVQLQKMQTVETKLAEEQALVKNLRVENRNFKVMENASDKERKQIRIIEREIRNSADSLEDSFAKSSGILNLKISEPKDLSEIDVLKDLNVRFSTLAKGYQEQSVMPPVSQSSKSSVSPSVSPSEDVIELRNKLAAKEEAVGYFKGREKELQSTIGSLNKSVTQMGLELEMRGSELAKVKDSYLAFLKKNQSTSKGEESADKEKNTTNIASSVSEVNSDIKALLTDMVKSMQGKEGDVTIFYDTLAKECKRHSAVVNVLQRQNLVLQRDNRKARRVAGKVLYKNPVSESKHKRSKEREDSMAIMRVMSGVIKGDDISSASSKIKEMLVEIGPIPTTSIKAITSDVAIIRTPEPFNNMPSYALGAFGPSKPISLMHVSSWSQLIVHDVPFDKSIKTIYDLVVWLYQMFPSNSVSGMYANTLACYPRMVNPLEFFSGKGTASFILCYSSKEVFASALRYGITLLNQAKPLRTEPVLGYMKNPFNQAGFMIQFEPFSQSYGYPDEKVKE